ncbi:MAG: 2-phospho-L-lactate guanylyltransferase [Acidimicrobiales bacterium]|jgi:2-phospho-L-lactate guanylyltransferase|nr:2-phospho-L-lactate guanylyltransferase [Actinomycetes bacterium]MDP6910986.1 2-phospho-L-lactate guanylyltransferase [Acidimicrobiales bacterium]HCW01439.1 2-phospho-L-lactate guanylyltransferase [Acidimicrobiaceae bacterium]HJM73683.1 2-phospho-L-lactate guanylyltransferase [Acidimicrobiales bacterium]HJP25132.1 2-phospho-L-lactate guanylyltransferase [Acidimicrobiales bacterium]
MSGPIGVLIPVKAFTDAKGRLAGAVDANGRADLARAMATTVVAAAAPLPVTVVCDDDGVDAWARSVGAAVIRVHGPGLNRAVEAGVAALAADGVPQVVIAHADLPRATRLDHCAATQGITLVPDRNLDGTPVLSVPTDAGFRFAYGPGSYAAHVAEAERLGLPWRSLHDPDLAFDVDDPADLEGLDGLLGFQPAD